MSEKLNEVVGQIKAAVTDLKKNVGENAADLKDRYEKLAGEVKKIDEDIKKQAERKTAKVEGDAVGAAAKFRAKGYSGVTDLHEIDPRDDKGNTLLDNDEIAALQLAEDVAMLHEMAKFGKNGTAYQIECARDGEAATFCKYFPKTGRRWNKFVESLTTKTNILDTATSGEGSEWVPVGYGRSLFDQIRLGTPEVGMFPRFQMTSKTHQLPLLTGVNTCYIKSEATAATLSSLTTANRTWTAYAFASYAKWSDEIEEDSIVALLPVVRSSLLRSFSEGLSMAIVNGDDDGANHFDNDYVLSTGTPQTYNSSFRGVRWMVHDAGNHSLTAGTTVDGGGNDLSAADVLNGLAKMGKFAARRRSDVALLVNPEQFFNLIGDTNYVTTVEKYGSSAPVVTGELGSVFGIPILISHAIDQRKDSTNGANGTNDSGTANLNNDSIALLVNHRNWLVGERRPVMFETDKTISTGVNEMIVTARWGFNYIEANATGAYPAVAIINVD